jgi:branched-chain amino acid transport system permease protein
LTRAVRRGALVAGLLALVLFPLVVTRPFPRHVLTMVFLYGTLATAWNLLGGYCGQISLGHAVYFGVGAYTPTLLFRHAELTPWLGMLAGAALAVAVSQVIGYPVFRLRGHYFAIATIAVGEIVQTLVINWDWAGGARGLFVPLRRPDSWLAMQFHEARAAYYYLALALLAVALLLTRIIERSRRGYYWRAIREDELAAATLGVPVAREKQWALGVSAALTALGGTFYAQYVLFIDPESVFPLSLSILICLVAVLGGVGTLWGPVVGAAVLIPLGEFTRVWLGGGGKAVHLLLYGGLIVVFAVVQPAGLVGLVRRVRHP